MKQFKLIKEYPGSPKLGHIICCNDFTHNGIDRHSCSNYPEFWEKVIEKDYEILSIIHKKTRTILNDSTNLKAYEKPENRGKWLINSVRRLSDGEVFTVGDKLKTGVIKEIFLPNNISIKEVTFHVTKDDEDIYLSEAIKLKQPLFTTEDGVDIYEDDEVVCLDIEDLEICANTKYKFQPMDVDNKNYLFFKDIKNAEEYVIMNKPCLSLNDIFNSNSLSIRRLRTNVLTMDILVDLVKEKLKL